MDDKTPQNKIKRPNDMWHYHRNPEYNSMSYPYTRLNMMSASKRDIKLIKFEPVRTDVLMKEVNRYLEESPQHNKYETNETIEPTEPKEENLDELNELENAIDVTIIKNESLNEFMSGLTIISPQKNENKPSNIHTGTQSKRLLRNSNKFTCNWVTRHTKVNEETPKLKQYTNEYLKNTPITNKTTLSSSSKICDRVNSKKHDFITPKKDLHINFSSNRYENQKPQSVQKNYVLQEKNPNINRELLETPKSREDIQFSMPLPAKSIQNKSFGTLVISGKEYIIINKIGEGGSCQVYNCLDSNTLQMRAVKIVNLSVDAVTANGYMNEVKILESLQNSNHVIKMFHFEFSKKTLYVVMEKGEIDLSVLLRDITMNSSRLPLYVINYYWMEMLQCVREIHNSGIIHSDLKPSNFLLVAGRLKLIDFGISSSLTSDMTSVIKNVHVGTFNYISPEALLDSRENSSPTNDKPRIRISYKSDVWSLGCILYQLVYKKTPFHQFGNSMAKLAVIIDKNHKIDYSDVPGVPAALINTIKKCLQYDVKLRPTVTELINMNESYFI